MRSAWLGIASWKVNENRLGGSVWLIGALRQIGPRYRHAMATETRGGDTALSLEERSRLLRMFGPQTTTMEARSNVRVRTLGF